MGNRVQFDFLRKESCSHRRARAHAHTRVHTHTRTHTQSALASRVSFPSMHFRPNLVAVMDPCNHLTGSDNLLMENSVKGQ